MRKIVLIFTILINACFCNEGSAQEVVRFCVIRPMLQVIGYIHIATAPNTSLECLRFRAGHLLKQRKAHNCGPFF